MTRRIPTNVAASVRQRLYHLAKEKDQDFNFVLGRFVAERLLFRLSVSESANDFVLKGALLFLLWSDHLYRPTRDVDAWVGQKITVLITEMDRAKSNVVVSRRKWLEKDRLKQRDVVLSTLTEGQRVQGTVISLTAFGAFVDIGGVEGLLHISDLSWKRIDKADKLLKVGQTIDVKVLKFDRETKKISLGLKQLQPHPWEGIQSRYPLEATVKGKVTSLTTFGAFVELEPGVEGLIHISEFSWKERNAKPADHVKVGDEISARVVLVDPAKEKLSLSIKRLGVSPWELAKANYPSGSKTKGKVTHLAVEAPGGFDVSRAEAVLAAL